MQVLTVKIWGEKKTELKRSVSKQLKVFTSVLLFPVQNFYLYLTGDFN